MTKTLRSLKAPTIDTESGRKPPQVCCGQRRSALAKRRDELKRSTRFDVLLRNRTKTGRQGEGEEVLRSGEGPYLKVAVDDRTVE